jgi:hypothetical protein
MNVGPSDTVGSAYQTKTSTERREKLLVNTAGIFADLASGGGDVDERRLREIIAPLTIVDAKRPGAHVHSRDSVERSGLGSGEARN